jgi:hypothetical protein
MQSRLEEHNKGPHRKDHYVTGLSPDWVRVLGHRNMKGFGYFEAQCPSSGNYSWQVSGTRIIPLLIT